MKTGLVSISFRKLSVTEISALTAESGLECVEWGGDVHVPHGDLSAAREARKITAGHGLSVSAYGSYLRLGTGKAPAQGDVLASAVELGAPTIRVWAGGKGSADCTDSERAAVVEDALKFAGLAASAGVTVSYEFHSHTLTDSPASAGRLLRETEHPAIRSFWQPPNGWSMEDALASMDPVLPKLSNVHAFHWWPDAGTRLLLGEGADRWNAYLRKIRAAGHNPDVLLEFVRDDDPSLLKGEAATLRRILHAVG